MNLFRRTMTTHTAGPEPDLVPATDPEPAPPRFAPWELASAWARAAEVFAEPDGHLIRRAAHYPTWEPVPTGTLRRELAAFAAAAGWPTDHPVGRLDALEQAARELVSRFYRRPDESSEINPLAPPVSWARRGEQGALPSPIDSPVAVAEVFVAEACYTAQGRAIVALFGQLHCWDHAGQAWRLWGSHEDMTATLGEWLSGEQSWVGDVLQPTGPVTTAIAHAVDDLLSVSPRDRWPSNPAAVAAFDHRRAVSDESIPRHAFVDGLGAYTQFGGTR